LIVPNTSKKSFAKDISSRPQVNIVESTVEVEVVIEVEDEPVSIAAKQLTCSRLLGEYVVKNVDVAKVTPTEDGSLIIEIPYPTDLSFYDGCSKVGEFVPKASLSNPRIIQIIHSQIVARNRDLASTHSINLAAKDESVEISFRPRSAAPAGFPS